MNTKRKTILGIILFAVFLIIAYFAYGALSNYYKPNQEAQSVSNTSLQESKKTPAPDFTVFDAKGNKVKLSDFKGRPVVLNFWASWCPPCKGEMPHFNEVYADAKNDVVFMMVDLVNAKLRQMEKSMSKSKGMISRYISIMLIINSKLRKPMESHPFLPHSSLILTVTL